MATEASIPEDASAKNTELEDRDLKMGQLDSISNECSREGSVKPSCGFNQFPQGFECSSEAEKADIVGDQTKNIMTTSTRTPKDISSEELSSPDKAQTEDISDLIVNQELIHICENEKHHSKDIATGADKNEVINGINVEEEHVHEKANDAAQVSRLACAEEPILKVHEEESLDQNLQVVKNQNASTQAISEIMETEMISSQKNENTTSKGEKDSNLECNEQARSIFEANLGPINEDLLPNLDWAAKSLGNEDERMIESCIKDEDIDSNNTKYAEDEYKEITLKAGQNKKKEMPSALEGERKAPESVVSSDKSEHCYEEHKLMHDRTEDASTVNVAESPYNHSFEEATLKTTSKNEASTEGVALEAGESMNEASSKACQEKNKDNESIWQEKDVPPVDGKDKAEKSAWLNRDGGGAKEDEFSQIGLSETIENSKTTPLNAEKSTEQNEQQDKLGGHVALIPENTEIVAPRENAEKSTEQVRHAIEKYEEEEEEEKDEPTSITDSGETLFPTEKSHLLVESITKNESAELKIPQKNASDVDSKYPLVEKTEQAESVETGEISKTEQTCAENENQAEDQSEEESKGTELGKVPKAHTDEKVEIVDGGKIIPQEAKEGEAANDMQLHKAATESVPETEATSRLSSTEFIRDEAIEQGFQEESIKDAELTLATDNESPRQESIKDVERNTKVDEAFDEPSTGRENTSDVTSEGSSADASGVPKNTTCTAVVDDSKKNEAEIQEVGEQSNAENSVSKSQEKENTARTLSSASGMETGKEYPEEDLNEETRMKEEVHVMITETKEQIEAAYSTERKISSTSDDFLEPKENHGDLTTEENKNNLVENSPSISGVFEKDDCSTNDSETDFLKVASEGNTAMKEVKPVNEERLETSDAAPENRNIETIEKKANSLDNVNIDEKQEEETISEENRNMKAADVADEADEGGQQMSHDIKDKALITRIDHEKEVTISTPEKTPARDDTLYVDSQTSFIVHSNSMLGSSDNEHEHADEGIQKHPDEDLMTLKTENNISGTEETEQWKGEQFSGLADENDASKLEIVKDEKSIVDVSKNINDVSCNEKAELEDEEVAEKAEANSAVVGVEREAAELTKAGSSTTEEESTDTKNAELADKNIAFKLEIVKEEKSTVEVLKHIEDVSSYSLDNEKAELQDEELVEKYEANSSVSVERKAAELKAGSSITDEEPADTKDNELEDENEASQLEIVEDESTVEVPKHIEDVSCMDNEKAELEDEEVTEKAEANSAVVGVEREAAELIKAGSSTTEEEPADTKNAELVDKNAAFKLEIVKEEKSTVEVLKHIEDVSSRSLDNEKAELEDEELVEKYEANSSVGTEREAAELNAGSSITEEEPVGTKDDELEDENEASQLEIVEDESTVEVPKHIEDVSWMDNEKTDMEDEELVEKVEGNSAVAVVEREATELDAVSSSTEEEPANTKNDELLIEKADRTYENIPCESDHNVESHEKILDMSLQKKEESLLGEHDNSIQEGASIDDQHEHAYSAIVMEDNGEKSGLVKGKDQDAKITLKCGEYLKQTLLNDGREKLEEISDIISERSKEDASREYTENTSTIREPTTIRLEKISHKENVEEKVNAVDGTKENEAENPEVLVTDGASQATSEKIIKVCESSNSETSVLKSQEEIENPVGTLSSASVGKEKGKEYPNDDKNEDTKIMEEVQVTNSESKEEIEETFVIYREISNTLHDSSEPKDDHGALSTEENKIKLVKNSSETSSIENSKGASTLGSSENEKENADEGIQKHKDEHEAPPSELKTETNISDAEDIEQNTPLADENEASKLEIVKDEKSTVQVSKHIEDVSCMEVEKAKLEEEELVQKSERNSAIVAVEREAAELKAGSSSTEEPADTKNDELADGKDASKLEIVEDESTIEDASCVDNEKTELENEDLIEKVEGISAIVAVEREAAELKAGSSSTEEPADTKNDELADGKDASKLEIVEDESTIEVPKHIEDASRVDNEKNELENEDLVEKVEGISAVVAVEREAAELKAGSSSTEEEPADTKNDELADGNDASKLEIVEDESTVEVPKHIEDASCVDNEKTELENEVLVQKVEGNSAVVAVKREAGSSSTEEEPSDTKNDELADGNDASKLEIVEDESTTEVPKHTEDASCVDNEKTELENEDLVEKVEGNSAVVGVERDTTKLKARSSSNEEEPSDKKTDELLMEEADRKDEDIHTKSDHNVKSTEKILGMSVQRKEESRVPEGASLEDQDEYTYSISVVDDEKSGLAEGKDQDAKITLKCEEQLKQTPQNDGKEKLEELPDMISEGIKPEASIEYPENTNTAEEPTTTRLEKFSKKKNEAENQEVPVATDASQATSEKVTKAPGPSNTEASVSKPQEEIENTVGTLSSASVGMETGKEYPDEEESQGTKVKVTIEESKEQIEATYLIEREISNTLHGFSEPKEDHGASSMEENKNNLVENSPVLEVFEKDACSPNGSKIEFLRAVSEGNPAIQELKPVNQEQLQGSDASPEMKDVTAIETKENSLGQVEETNSRKNKDVKVQEVADEGAQRLPLNEEQKEIETSMKTDKTPARDGTLYVESGTSFIGHSEGASILGSSENEKKDANEGIEKHKDEDQALLSDLKTETNISNTEEIEQWKREQFSGLADENEGSKLETVKDEKSTLEVSKHIEVFSCIKSEKAVLEEKVLAENAEENSAVVGLEREATEMKERSPNTEEEPANTEKGETLMEKTFNDLQSDRTDENIPCESNENVEGPEEILDTSLKTKDKSLLGEHDNPTPREASIEDQDEYANSVSAAKDNDEEYSKQMLQNDGKERLEELPDMIFARSVADASREYPENTTCATGEETTARLERTSQKENIEENVKAIDDIKENKAENQEVLVTAATIQANREKMIKKKVCESSNTEDSVSKPQEIENTVRTLPSASVKIEPSKEYPEEDESEETNMKEEVKVTITESKEQIEEAYSIERKVSNISDDFFEPKEVHGDWSTEENKNTIVENSSSISGVFDKEQPETSEPTPENRNITDIESKANSLDSVNIDEKQEEETVSNEIRDLKVAEVEAESRQRLSCDIKDEALITGINHEKEVTISTPLLDDQLVRTFIDSSVLPSYEEPKTKDKTPERDGTIYVDSETSSIGHSKGDSLLGSSDNEKENADEGIQKPRDEDLYVPPELITENNISDMDYREKWKKEQVSGLADRHDACKLETVNNEEATVEVSKHMEVVTDLNSERAVPEEEELAEESEDSSAVLELEREEAAQKVASPSAEEESASTKNGELPIEKVHYKVETADNNENIKELLTGSRTISVGEETGNKVEVSNSGFKEQTEATELTVEKESVTLESHTEQNMEIIHFSASTSTDSSETYSEHSSSTSKVYEKQTEAEVSKKDKAVIDDAKNDSLTVVIEETDLKKVEQVNEENNKGSDSAADNNGLTTIAAEMTTLDCKDIDERQEKNSSPEKKWILDEVNEGHLKMNRCVKEIDKTTATQHEREVIISSIPMSIEEKDTMTTATFNTIETADETAETYLHARENELLQKEHEVCKPGGVTELETVDIRMECSNDNIIKLDNEDLHMLSDENTKTTSTGKDGKVTQGQENLATTFEGSLTGVSIKKAATAQYFSHEHKPADELSADKTVEAANTDEKLELASESMAKEQNDEKIYQAKGKGNTEDPIFKSSDDIPGKKLQGEAQRKSTQFEVVHHISVPQNAHETSATDGCTEKVLKGNEEANGSENILEQILGPKRISNEPDIVSAVDKTVNEVTEKNSESIKQIEEMNERESEILGNFPKANEDFSSLTTIEASEEGTQREDNKTLFRMSSLVSQEVEKEIKAEIFQKENDTHSTFQTLPCTLVNEETSFKETTEEHSRQVDNFAPFSEGKDVAITDTVKPSLEINDPDDIQEKSSSSEKSREYQSLEIVDEAGQNMDQDFRGQAPTTGVEHENEEGSRLTLIEHDNLQNPSVMQTEEDNHLPDKISNPMAKYLAGEDHDAEKDVHDVIRPEDFPELGIAVIEKSDNKEIQNQDDEDLNQLHNLNTQSILSYRKDVEIPRTEKGSVSTNQSEACTMEMEKDKKPCIEVSKYTADETCIESEKDSENFRSSSNFITAEKLPAESTKTEKDELPEEKILEPAHLGTKLKSSSDFEAHNQTNEQLPQIKEKSNNIQDWISVSVEHIPGQTSVTSLVTKEVRVDEAGGSENIEEQIINSEVNLMEPQILSARGATVNLVKDRNFISTKNLKATDSSEQKVIVDLTIEDDPTRKEAAVEVLKVESSTRQAESDKRNHYLASEINENVLQMPLKPIEETIPEVQRKNEEPRRATGINTGVEETEVREEKIGHLEEPQQAAAILNEEARIGSEKDDKGGDECREVDPVSGATVTVEGSKDTGVKVTHRKSHNILSGVGSKVKHSISKVKKAITGKSSHPKSLSPK